VNTKTVIQYLLYVFMGFCLATEAAAQNIPRTQNQILTVIIGPGNLKCKEIFEKRMWDDPVTRAVHGGYISGYLSALAARDVEDSLGDAEGLNNKLNSWWRQNRSAGVMARVRNICTSYPDSILASVVLQLAKEIAQSER
jgi:hypothetical protein